MEWEAPSIVLDVRPYGEGDAVATVFTEEHGAWRGLVRGGLSRRQAATWQPSNLVALHWVARLSEQLGTITGELVHATAAGVMDDPLLLAAASACCAVAEGALPEREPHPASFRGLLHVLAHLPQGPAALTELIRWEAALLADLGYGLDLARCAVTGSADDLSFVSPRSGRAVSAAGAGIWRERLLPLPHFLLGQAPATPRDWRDGLRLTGHFLARDAFGHTHRPLPAARATLAERVERLVVTSPRAPRGT